jgi:hypothetical protein
MDIDECLRYLVLLPCPTTALRLRVSLRKIDRRLHIDLRHIECGHFNCHLRLLPRTTSYSFHPTTWQHEPLRTQCHPSGCPAHRCWCFAGTQKPWPVHQRALQTGRIGCASRHSHQTARGHSSMPLRASLETHHLSF